MATASLSDHPLRIMRPAEVETSAKEIFLAWLLNLPDGVEVLDAAIAEIDRLDRLLFLSPCGKRLRELFFAAVKCSVPEGPLS